MESLEVERRRMKYKCQKKGWEQGGEKQMNLKGQRQENLKQKETTFL